MSDIVKDWVKIREIEPQEEIKVLIHEYRYEYTTTGYKKGSIYVSEDGTELDATHWMDIPCTENIDDEECLNTQQQ